MELGFIGAGKVGTGLALSLSKNGYVIKAVYDTKVELADLFCQVIEGCAVANSYQELVDSVNFVFITTPDAYIEQVCSLINWRAGQFVVHCSGANSVDLLESAKKEGAHIGVFHPGLSFANRRQALENIAGSTFDIEGEEQLLGIFKEMAESMKSYWLVIDGENKPLYHVAVEFASLFVMLLFRVSADMMQAMGITEEQAIKIALPMIRGTANNIEKFGTSQPLTGPADRGDIDTIKKHIDHLLIKYPNALPLYRELVRQNIGYSEMHDVINKQEAEKSLSTINQHRNYLV